MAILDSSPLTEPHSPQELRQAFDLFNEMSQQLSRSYEQLQGQVHSLSGELAAVTRARMQELKEKERIASRLEHLLHLLPGGVIVLDGSGVVTEVNAAAQKLLFAPKGSATLIGKKWRDLILHNFQPRADDGHEVSLRDGRRVSIQTTSLEVEPGQIILLIDQTETRELQERLSHHQRLMAMGRMVASLAHQVRTPVSTALLYADHLQQPELADDKKIRFAGKIKQQLKHIEAQVRDMLIFARGSAPLNQIMPVDELCQHFKELAEQTELQKRVFISVNCQCQSGFVQCHFDSLLGAVSNLINNGIEAAEIAGIKPAIKLHITPVGENLCIDVADNGPGINPELLSKLTEPFFTTKTNGTGLGLSVVQAVVRAHHGTLTMNNGPQQGAVFSLNLPMQQKQKLQA